MLCTNFFWEKFKLCVRGIKQLRQKSSCYFALFQNHTTSVYTCMKTLMVAAAVPPAISCSRAGQLLGNTSEFVISRQNITSAAYARKCWKARSCSGRMSIVLMKSGAGILSTAMAKESILHNNKTNFFA